MTKYRRIIFPQVIKRVIPPISNEHITLVKDTSLVYILGLNDLLKIAIGASNRDPSLMPFVSAGLIYILMTAISTQLLSVAEKKFSYYS
nr:ABC transporter permease subunit [Erysipelothrix piscisicarius]